MTSIGKKTFDAALPRIREVVQDADFLALDLEFSSFIEDQKTFLATPKDIYKIMIQTKSRPQILQFGLCAFKMSKSPEDGSDILNSTPLSFSTIPKKPKPFTFLSSSLQFLSRHSFDFNRWVADAVPYLTAHELAELEAKRAREEAEPMQRDALSHHLLERLKEVEAFVAEQLAQEGEHPPRRTVEYPDKLQPYVRYAVYAVLQAELHAAGARVLFRSEDGDRPLKTLFVDIFEDEAAFEAQCARDAAQRLPSAQSGFLQVLNILAEAQRPVVVFSGLLDVFLVLAEYVFGYDFPPFKDFAAAVRRYFPMLVDLKLIIDSPDVARLLKGARGNKLHGGSLGALFEFFQRQEARDKASLAERILSLDGDAIDGGFSAAHDASYDAFMTGKALVQLRQFMAAQGAPCPFFPNDLFLFGSFSCFKLHAAPPALVASFAALDTSIGDGARADTEPFQLPPSFVLFPVTRAMRQNQVRDALSGFREFLKQRSTDSDKLFFDLKFRGRAVQVVVRGSPEAAASVMHFVRERVTARSSAIEASAAAWGGRFGAAPLTAADYCGMFDPAVLAPPSADGDNGPSVGLFSLKKFHELEKAALEARTADVQEERAPPAPPAKRRSLLLMGPSLVAGALLGGYVVAKRGMRLE